MSEADQPPPLVSGMPAESPDEWDGRESVVPDTLVPDTVVPDTVSAPSDKLMDSVAAAGQVRPGPGLLDADRWETDPSAGDAADAPYLSDAHGHRRPALPWTRIVLVAGLVLLAGTVLAVPVSLSLPQTETALTTATGVQQPASAPSAMAGELVSAVSSQAPSEAPQLVPPAVRAKGPATAQPPPAPPTLSAAASPPSPPPTPSAPLVYEAETPPTTSDNVVISTVSGASGGTVVDRIGEWGGRDGWVQFSVSVPTAGGYLVKVSYLFLQSSSDTTRKARITLNGTTLPDITFPRVTVCCAEQTILLTLVKDTNTLKFTHPDVHSPAIDKIVVAKP